MMAARSSNSSGRFLVVALVGAGLLFGAVTWWNYKRFHPSTQDAYFAKANPPTIHAAFPHPAFAIDRTYLATVTLHGGDRKFSGQTRDWKQDDSGNMSTEIVLTDTPDAPLNTPCVVTLDLEIKSASD